METSKLEKLTMLAVFGAEFSHFIGSGIAAAYQWQDLAIGCLEEGDLEEGLKYLSNSQKILKMVGGVSKVLEGIILSDTVGYKKFGVNKAINELLEYFRIFHVTGVDKEINFNFEPDGLYYLTSSRALYQLSIFNLLRNAVTADSTEVNINLKREKGVLVTSIADNGNGIPKDKLKKIQEPFVSYTSGGKGIGLASVRYATYLMGGQLDINSKLGEGTIVSLYVSSKK